ncbi:cell wall metabolism sensor histidine kinase WalK [Streptomyces sp. MK37H]|uniref:sensor histidine kinase n=1 Tax=Streptomyces sp. MK37H TaxID=2699117 RepID=UPI001B37A255|nr:HAMP domain-containing sensor histidine kinase [Streptomyces sp. MK37H]MBP8535315.1 sensor histidine kinase [Streptomyces sp. MK37H]
MSTHERHGHECCGDECCGHERCGDELCGNGPSHGEARGEETYERQQRLEVLLHELRTSLTTIRGWAELPLQGLSDDPELMVRALRRIQDEADHMHQAVQQVFPRADASWVRPLETEPVDLRDVADEAVADLGLLDPERPIAREDSGRATVVADNRMLRHAVRNLLDNALRHTPAGSPVTVAVRGPVAGDGVGAGTGTGTGGMPHVELSVSDQGPGMGPQDIARLTSPRDEDGRIELGGGIGLTIVRRVVERHGGEVSVSSAPGRGTTVTVAFPTVSVSSGN